MAILTAYDRGASPIAVYNLTEADSIQNVFLGSASVESITIPTTAGVVIFRADGSFYYRVDANPAVPTTEVVSDGSILIPANLWDGDNWENTGRPTTVRFIRATAVNTILTVLFYDS